MIPDFKNEETTINDFKQMARAWREDYEKRIGREHNSFLLDDLQEEIDIYISHSLYSMFKVGVISKHCYQQSVAAFLNEWSILRIRIKEVEELLHDVKWLWGDKD